MICQSGYTHFQRKYFQHNWTVLEKADLNLKLIFVITLPRIKFNSP